MRPHQFGKLGDWGVGADPVDTLVHHVFDFHGDLRSWVSSALMQCNGTPNLPNSDQTSADTLGATLRNSMAATSRPEFPPKIATAMGGLILSHAR
ncbi:hypothetical protein TM233_48200 [Bradyrhizobium sp. TM233]|nr:hypothetical protein TM233_48200 [Bradyrhizobium sp. TM233]